MLKIKPADLMGGFSAWKAAGGWQNTLGLSGESMIRPLDRPVLTEESVQAMVGIAQLSTKSLLNPKPNFFVASYGANAAAERWAILPLPNGQALPDHQHFFIGAAKRAEATTDAMIRGAYRFAKWVDSQWLTMPLVCLVMRAMGFGGTRLFEVNPYRVVTLVVMDPTNPQAESKELQLTPHRRMLFLEVGGRFIEPIGGVTTGIDPKSAKPEEQDAEFFWYFMLRCAVATGKRCEFVANARRAAQQIYEMFQKACVVASSSSDVADVVSGAVVTEPAVETAAAVGGAGAAAAIPLPGEAGFGGGQSAGDVLGDDAVGVTASVSASAAAQEGATTCRGLAANAVVDDGSTDDTTTAPASLAALAAREAPAMLVHSTAQAV